MPRFKNASVKPVDDGSVLYIVFRSAPFGKHVGRRKKGEDLFKADRWRTKVRRGRIWTKDKNNRKNEGSRSVPTYEAALPQVFYRAETLLLRFILLSFGLIVFRSAPF